MGQVPYILPYMLFYMYFVHLPIHYMPFFYSIYIFSILQINHVHHVQYNINH